ncbi:serine/threonine-protein phosphatase 6 regulatory ankyrin repeat subunit C-like [Passer domesticus]
MPLHIAARNGLASVVQALLSRGATVLAVDEEGHTPALACAPNKDVADCLALILSTMKPFPPKDALGSFSLSLLTNCGIAAKAAAAAACGALPVPVPACGALPVPACGALPVPARGALPVPACGALPNGSSCPYSKERHSAIGLDGCYSE